MSTRSTIGVENPDGSVISIYCHFDGYPEHHVPILTEAYATEERARALVALGDLSSLGRELGEKHDFNCRPEGVCNAYGRDRGESGTEPHVSANMKEFETWADHDYTYLFKDGSWLARSWSGSWKTAADLLAEAEAAE